MIRISYYSYLRFLVLALTVILLSSCGTKSKIVTTKDSRESAQYANITKASERSEINNKAIPEVIQHAKKFQGTKYKFGGTTKKGMDCSGLVYVSFLEEGIPLPRTSRALSLQGRRLFLKEVVPGDLLFFETNKNKRVINHVGLVVQIKDDEIYFIHSSTSRGVIISSLSEYYWKNNFVMARRVI